MLYTFAVRVRVSVSDNDINYKITWDFTVKNKIISVCDYHFKSSNYFHHLSYLTVWVVKAANHLRLCGKNDEVCMYMQHSNKLSKKFNYILEIALITLKPD